MADTSNVGPTLSPEEQKAFDQRQARINRDLPYLMEMVDRAIARKSPKVSVRTEALVTVLQVVTLSSKVAGEQRRQLKLPWWRRLLEVLREPR